MAFFKKNQINENHMKVNNGLKYQYNGKQFQILCHYIVDLDEDCPQMHMAHNIFIHNVTDGCFLKVVVDNSTLKPHTYHIVNPKDSEPPFINSYSDTTYGHGIVCFHRDIEEVYVTNQTIVHQEAELVQGETINGWTVLVIDRNVIVIQDPNYGTIKVVHHDNIPEKLQIHWRD